jgi:pyridoxine/pyridoxamine 5'-phosphate oxidase
MIALFTRVSGEPGPGQGHPAGKIGHLTDHGIPLREEDRDGDPLRQFASWFGEAEAADVREPEAAALVTASADDGPSVRGR